MAESKISLKKVAVFRSPMDVKLRTEVMTARAKFAVSYYDGCPVQ